MIVIAPLPCAKNRIRLKKLINFKNERNEKILFYGWNRDNDLLEISEPMYESFFILSGGGFANRKARLMYFSWFFAVLKTCLSFEKDEVVWAMGFETAFPALIVSKIKGFKVIFDDPDRFSYIFKKNNFFISVIRFLERKVSKNSYIHIIPCFERYSFKNKSMFVLKNTPEKIEVEKARKICIKEDVQSLRKKYEIIIYVNGWLTDTRGMEQVSELAKHKDLGILIAGRIDSNYILNILDLSNVLYLGEVSSVEALSLYLYSDFVLTYYDPDIPINILAESNKWGDAIEMKTPIIINSEVITGGFLHQANVCISNPYSDTESLYSKILNTNLVSLKENINRLSNDIGFFDEQLESLFRQRLGK